MIFHDLYANFIAWISQFYCDIFSSRRCEDSCVAKSDLTPKELEIRNKFGERIQFLRLVRKMTQEQLAVLVKRTAHTISMIETAQASPSFEVILRLAEAFDVEVGDLFHFDHSVPGE
jgi:DNA-binding XRE family transcriptional regulator